MGVGKEVFSKISKNCFGFQMLKLFKLQNSSENVLEVKKT